MGNRVSPAVIGGFVVASIAILVVALDYLQRNPSALIRGRYVSDTGE